jgi:hypothetical protein
MIAELREKHRLLGEAITVLDALSLGGEKRLGRPRKWASNLPGASRASKASWPAI